MNKSCLLLLTILLLVASCSKEEQPSIVGTWKVNYTSSISEYGYIDPFLVEVIIDSEVNEDFFLDESVYFVFRDNDTVSLYFYDSLFVLNQYQHRTYAIDDSTSILTIYNSDSSEWPNEITSLTSTNLNFRTSSYEEYPYNPRLNSISSDTTFFERLLSQFFMTKSELPSITTELLTKKNPVISYSSFFSRRKNR